MPRPAEPNLSGDTAILPPRRVLFFRRAAYGAFKPSSHLNFGGAEVRSRTFALGLAQRPAFEVSFLVGPRGENSTKEHVGNVCLVSEPQPQETFFEGLYAEFRQYGEITRHFPYLQVKRFHPSLFYSVPLLALQVTSRAMLPARWRVPKPRRLPILRELAPDVVCCFGAAGGVADVIASCRAYGLPSLLFVVSDSEAEAQRLATNSLLPEFGDYGPRLRFAMKKADVIIAQTERQRELIRECHGREAVVLHNPIELAGAEPLPAAAREFVLWVGRAESPEVGIKRPELCVELARRLPDVPFLAVINPVNALSFAAITAAAPANLTILESVPREQIEDYYRRAGLFINTSVLEGFPNTFLEAAKYQTPIVSLAVDPDGFLSRHGCGMVCEGDLGRMAGEVQSLWGDAARREEIGATARRYVEREYELSACIDQLAALIENVCGKARQKKR